MVTKLKITYGYMSGYSSLKYSGKVTKSIGRRIYEIDGKPTAPVYNTWTGGIFEEQIKTGESILGPASFFPLAQKFTVGKETYWVSVHPSRFDLGDGSLEVFAEAPEGSDVWLLEGTPDILIERPIRITQAALGKFKLKPRDVGFGILIYCAGTMLPVKDKIGDSIKRVYEILKAPFIGAFTFGEQGHIKGYGNFHGNLMADVVLVSKKKKRFPFF